MKHGNTPSRYYQALLLTAAALVLLTFAVVVSSQDATDKKSRFRDPEVVRNKEHVQEHLEELTGEKREEDMTDEELEFHYFKLHDFDNNTKLDGLEILAAINHVLGHEALDKNMNQKEAIEKRLKRDTDMIDQVLLEDDFNNDGYLTYLEFVLATGRRREEAADDDKHKKTK